MSERLAAAVDAERAPRDSRHGHLVGASSRSNLIVVLTEVSVVSNEVLAEVRAALDTETRVIPVLAEGCEVLPRLKITRRIDPLTGIVLEPGMDPASLLPSLGSSAQGVAEGQEDHEAGDSSTGP